MNSVFRYRAKNAQGIDKDGELETQDEKTAVKELQEKGLYVISIDKVGKNTCPKCLKSYDSSWKVCISCNTQLINREGAAPASGKISPQPPIYKKPPCPYCGSPNVGRVRGVQGGEVFIAIILYILLIIPGFIYYIYMETIPYCSDCGRRIWKK